MLLNILTWFIGFVTDDEKFKSEMRNDKLKSIEKPHLVKKNLHRMSTENREVKHITEKLCVLNAYGVKCKNKLEKKIKHHPHICSAYNKISSILFATFDCSVIYIQYICKMCVFDLPKYNQKAHFIETKMHLIYICNNVCSSVEANKCERRSKRYTQRLNRVGQRKTVK